MQANIEGRYNVRTSYVQEAKFRGLSQQLSYIFSKQDETGVTYITNHFQNFAKNVG